MKRRISVRVLVIDDDQALCRQIVKWLEGADFDVDCTADASEARSRLRAERYLLALVDLRLPDVDSAGLIRQLRAESKVLRIIAMTAFPDTKDVIAAFRAGASDLLEKPLDNDSLIAALDRQLVELGITARTEPEFNRKLGSRLRERRTEVGQKLQEVAEVAGITAAQLSQIELGKTATTTWTLARICGALHVSPATLFEGGDGNPQ